MNLNGWTLKELTAPRIVKHWGQRRRITPRFVNAILGDGKQLATIEPMDYRPNYYIIRIDSKWSIHNGDPEPICDHLEEIYQAIEDQVGPAEVRYEGDNGRIYTKHYPFPAFAEGSGMSWGSIREKGKAAVRCRGCG